MEMKKILIYCLGACIFAGCTACNDTDSDKNLVIADVRMIARITGDALPSDTVPSPNNTGTDYDVYGTDLGIMWHMTDDRFGIFFGDTNGTGFEAYRNGGNGTNWRSNVLAFSNDTELENGLTINGMFLDGDGKADEVCAGGKSSPDVYQTSIPTSAIRAADTDCVHIMNIYNWGGEHGRWITNYSTLYTSEDDGKTWERCEEVTFAPDSHFSQIAYAKREGIVYMLGTQSGRGDDAYLARFNETDIKNLEAYEYWNGDSQKWVQGDEAAATPVLGGPVGEASLMWHKKFKRWIVTYNYDPNYDDNRLTKSHAILYRTSSDLINWSEPGILAEADVYPGLYCAFMHPLKDNDDTLWFVMSLWPQYNTFLMCADLKLE